MITYDYIWTHTYIYIYTNNNVLYDTCHIINQYHLRQLDDDLVTRKYAMEALDQGWALKNGQSEPQRRNNAEVMQQNVLEILEKTW